MNSDLGGLPIRERALCRRPKPASSVAARRGFRIFHTYKPSHAVPLSLLPTVNRSYIRANHNIWTITTVNSTARKRPAAMDRLRILSRGAVFEGDVFSVLRHCPFIVRAFEFALADGAINCTCGYSPTMTYAERVWELSQTQLLNESQLLLFDVKSNIGQNAEKQIYFTNSRQRRDVAFYIGVCAADPSFVELIPNLHQETLAYTNAPFSESEENRKFAINIAKVQVLPARTYGLNRWGEPYRMPLRLLPEAIKRVRFGASRVGQNYHRTALNFAIIWKFYNPHDVVVIPTS